MPQTVVTEDSKKSEQNHIYIIVLHSVQPPYKENVGILNSKNKGKIMVSISEN